MRVLYVVGSCLTKNTSANMSHNCYIQGLLENNCKIDIIMANDSWGKSDQGLPMWEDATYYVYNSVSKIDKIRRRFSYAEKNTNTVSNENIAEEGSAVNKTTLKSSLRILAKKLFYTLFPNDPVYPLDKEWMKHAINFKNKEEYDLVISNSSPAASHKLALQLIEKKHVTCRQWIQIWEDPWYFDLYGGHSELIKKEEQFLLSKASKIYYVSPLTLMYQKRYFSEYAEKMKFLPLPAMEYEKSVGTELINEMSFGYFGDYYSQTRNLSPFYEAISETGYKGYIYGDSDLHLKETDKLEIKGRVTLDKLSKIQENTGVLVHLCNLNGGQIPGKIYHYSFTNKPILFILDGTDEEKIAIYDYFKQFNRYYFCDNEKQQIISVMNKMKEEYKTKKWEKVNAFKPKEIIDTLLSLEKV